MYVCVCVRQSLALCHVMATVTHTHTKGKSEIENPVGLSRHYEEKGKVYFQKKKKKNE